MPRTLDHLQHLLRLLDVERQEERARLQAERAELTQAEREERGLSASDLEAVEESVGLGGRALVSFERAGRGRLTASLHPGDLVELRPRRAEVSEPVRGVVSQATHTRVQVALEHTPPPFVRDGRLLLDLVPNDVTFERARTAVERVAALEHGAARHTRELLLGNADPRFESRRSLALAEALNPEQREAAERALAARDFFCVHGPPGTGKSTVLAAVAGEEIRRGGRLLCTAASNAAVDHLLELCLDEGLRAVRIGHPARVTPRFQTHTLDLLVEEHPDRRLAVELFEEGFALLGYARRQRSRGRSRERFAHARASRGDARKLFDEARALERKAVDAVLAGADVLCGTLTSLGGFPLSRMRFSLALLDEATQATEPLSLLAFLAADRVVLAGDHRQLPPTVLSSDAAQAGLSTSLFERLLADHGPQVRQLLREQYRMSETLMTFPSREFYAGALRAHPSVATRTLQEVLLTGAEVDAPPFLFLDTAGKGFEEVQEARGDSHENPGEAALVAARAEELLAAGLPAEALAVITPYRLQASRLRERLEPRGVEVDTVDAFQGREAEAVLVSCVRSNPSGSVGFLADLRRMNVAITRARRHLFVVGDSATLARHPFYARLVERAQEVCGYRSAWEWPFGA